MPRKPKTTSRKVRAPTAAVSSVSRLTNEGFILKFTDIVARVAVQHYANLIGRRDPALATRLTEAVEAAGGWSDSELDAATMPEEEPDAEQD
jgi:hypothetical protein